MSVKSSAKIDVKKEYLGELIGVAGVNLRALRQRTGAHITLPPRNSTDTHILVEGTSQQVADAVSGLKAHLARIGQSRPVQRATDITVEIPIDPSDVGSIIGRQGATLKRMREETGASLNVQENPARVVVQGPPDAVQKAREAIDAFVARGLKERMATVREVEVEAAAVGLLIGPRGSTVKQIREDTGAQITIPREESSQGATVRVKVIGTPEQIAKAVSIIMRIAKDQAGLAVQRAKFCTVESQTRICTAYLDNQCDAGADCAQGAHPTVCYMFNTSNGCPIGSMTAGGYRRCPFGLHVKRIPETPAARNLFWKCTKALAEPVRRKWAEEGGNPSCIEEVYQIKNPFRQWKFECTRVEMTEKYHTRPDILEGFHGSAESNIVSICQQGFLKSCRRVMVFGEGDYFAKDPNVSVSYCKGGCYMLFCRILLGKERRTDREEGDHIWVPGNRYYVIADGDQVLPLFLIKFANPDSERIMYSGRGQYPRADPVGKFLCNDLANAESELRAHQTGAKEPGAFHRRCEMLADHTKRLWVGYLDPMLTDEEIRTDVCAFLNDLDVIWESIRIEKEGLRRAVRVSVQTPVSKAKVIELNSRPYHEKYRICVDDAQRDNPARNGVLCKRLGGINGYCRWANIQHVDDACNFAHPADADPMFNATYFLEELDATSAKFEEVKQSFLGSFQQPAHVLSVRKIVNPSLNERYERRKEFQNKKHGFDGGEIELWHGTNLNILDRVYKWGLRCPSDSAASPQCPVSGGKGLSTTLCNNDCAFCTRRHEWARCHMFGLGIYLADVSGKSHRYVSSPQIMDNSPPSSRSGEVFRMIRCRVHLGNPYLIDGHLVEGDGLHDNILPFSVGAHQLNRMSGDAEESPTGHDSYFVRGLGHAAVTGRSVIHSEFICFTPWQILPLYEVVYTVQLPPSPKVCEALDAEGAALQLQAIQRERTHQRDNPRPPKYQRPACGAPRYV